MQGGVWKSVLLMRRPGVDQPSLFANVSPPDHPVKPQSCKISISLHQANHLPRESRQFWHSNLTKLSTKDNFRVLTTLSIRVVSRNHAQNCMLSQTFDPNLQIYLHKYICHVREILHLCLILVYTVQNHAYHIIIWHHLSRHIVCCPHHVQ